MNQPTLRYHANGKIYIHWTKGRRSLRVSTGQDTMRGALLVYADWIVASIDTLFPPANPGVAIRQLHKGRLSSRPLTLSLMTEEQVADLLECSVPQLRKLRAALELDVELDPAGG